MNDVASMWDPLARFLERCAEFLPVLMAVVIVLLGGLILAWILEAMVRSLLSLLRFDRVLMRPQVSDTLRRAGLGQSPSAIVGQLVRWGTIVLAFVGAMSILSAEASDEFLRDMVGYVPRLLVGLMILVVGYALSTLVGRSVLLWSVNARLRGSRWLSGGARLLVGVFFLALALENLGFGRDIALVVLAILLGGGVLAIALAFGLAGKDLARQSLEELTREAREEDRDTFSHL